MYCTRLNHNAIFFPGITKKINAKNDPTLTSHMHVWGKDGVEFYPKNINLLFFYNPKFFVWALPNLLCTPQLFIIIFIEKKFHERDNN
jgi:hypothetical protein